MEDRKYSLVTPNELNPEHVCGVVAMFKEGDSRALENVKVMFAIGMANAESGRILTVIDENDTEVKLQEQKGKVTFIRCFNFVDICECEDDYNALINDSIITLISDDILSSTEEAIVVSEIDLTV